MAQRTDSILTTEKLRSYAERFNSCDEELYPQAVPNGEACAFLARNIPLFECPDAEMEQTYYFRWWTFRKHVKRTPDGYVITEFLPDVSWAGKHNTISCPAGHHFYEGRWLHDDRYLNDYAAFWFQGAASPRSYSFWAADAYYNRYLVNGDSEHLLKHFDDLMGNYREWEKTHLCDDGLFWQKDVRDGMERSISGLKGRRPTINSYMYGDAKAMAAMAHLADRHDLAGRFDAQAARIRQLVLSRLWDDKAAFFKSMPAGDEDRLSDVRELIGYVPWYFGLPESGKGYEAAWEQLIDPEGFFAPYGPPTAEQRHPRFQVSYEGHVCKWDGPSWPFATAQTLTALANVLNDYRQTIITKADYLKMLQIYARSHIFRQIPPANCNAVDTIIDNDRPWIDESLNPYNGDWLTRTALLAQGDTSRTERGKAYNHSTFCDLIITGLVGLRPRADDVIEVNPLLPRDTWDYFCLDNVKYHSRLMTIV